VYELRWTSGNVAVTIELKKISSPDSSGSGDSATASRGFHGLRLPDTIVGRIAAAPAAGPAVASVAVGGQ
jgi:type VI secretion system protein ImpL